MSDTMKATVDQAKQTVSTITSAWMLAAQAAAEEMGLAVEVARIQIRMEAHAAVLETIAVQKQALTAKLGESTGAMRTLLNRQIEMLSTQELGILEKVGIPADVATKAVEIEAKPAYHRDGRRFARNGAN